MIKVDYEVWWIWMVLAAIFLVAEIFTAGFFLLWFSFGSAAAGVLALLDVPEAGQFITFILVSGILFVFGRGFAERVTDNQPPGIGADRYAGKVAIVIEEVSNLDNTGYVRIDQDEFRATSESGEVLKEGAHVVVVKIDGTRAIVNQLKTEE